MQAPLASCMYAVVCSQFTKKKWSRAHKALLEKYETKWPGKVEEVTYRNGDLLTALPFLSRLKPTYTCFLAHHSESDKRFIHQIHKLTQEIDPSTPYSGTIWGVLTGLVEEDCLYALKHDPLTITRVVGNCPVTLEKFTSGVWFSESEQSVAWRKTSGGYVLRESCPPDVTETFVMEIGACRAKDEGVDMIVTSGHATESELNLGYCFRSGQIRCSDGHICGHSVDGCQHKLNLRDKTPKVLSAAGNCLMGHIRDEKCMALAWMHSAGVTQMVGYIVPTWYGYAGWGVHKYFINNPGRMTFAEAYFANQQSLLQRLVAFKSPKAVVENHEEVYKTKFGHINVDNVSSHDMSGLSYDEDTTVFYGDPAWEARLSPKPDLWDYSATVVPAGVANAEEDWSYWMFKVETLQPGQWECSVPDDKSTSPGRPPMYIFPTRVAKAKLISGNAVVTCNFVLMLLEGSFAAGEFYSVCFAIQCHV